MSNELPNEAQVVEDLIYGRGQFERSTAPEPALLPHMAARLCHDFSSEKILDAADVFGHQGRDAPPWLPLWEATLWSATSRPDIDEHLKDFGSIDAGHLEVMRALTHSDQGLAEKLANERIQIGHDYPDRAGLARLLRLIDPERARQLLADEFFPEPAGLDAESVRSVLAAAAALDVDVPDDWLDAVLDDSWGSEPHFSRQAHILPELPPDKRSQLADRLAQDVTRFNVPPDMRALFVSRIAPFVSSAGVWDRTLLFERMEPVWERQLSGLLDAGWPGDPWGDVYRAHPAQETVEKVSRPHEVTAGAPEAVVERWDTHSAMMASAEGSGHERSVDVPAPSAGPPGGSRRLQADIMHAGAMQNVNAFVAGHKHIVDVSIGRGGQVRADAPFDEDVFDETDADWLVLPVWFQYKGEVQKAKLRVPRDRSLDSRVASFELDAPDSGHVFARVHVFRPGGKLLQSASLVGDVVDDLAAAVGHSPPPQLSIDVVAAELDAPAPTDRAQTIIADEDRAVTEMDGSVVEIDASLLQDKLAKMVRAIEVAAGRQDADPDAVAKALQKLALAGQEMRARFSRELGDLANAPVLQIVSLHNGDVLPLELIYDGPVLSPRSEVCPTWREALLAGNCGGCAGGGPDDDDEPRRICPMRFWSMQKVIERRSADASSERFRVGSEPREDRPELSPIREVVVAASGKVADSDVDDLAEFVCQTLASGAERARNWSEWVSIVQSRSPELLLAMPHNASTADGLSSALMIGEPPDDDLSGTPETALTSGGVRSRHVKTEAMDPGPVALLLGCNTQFEKGRLSTFAGEFRNEGAAMTVATMGELRADHAPLAARVIVDELKNADGSNACMGDVLLRARRRLLSDGMVIALLLIGNGDAGWLLPGGVHDDRTDT